MAVYRPTAERQEAIHMDALRIQALPIHPATTAELSSRSQQTRVVHDFISHSLGLTFILFILLPGALAYRLLLRDLSQPHPWHAERVARDSP